MSYFNETNAVGDRSYGQSIPLTPLEEAQKTPPGWFAGTFDTAVTAGVKAARAVDLAGALGPMAQDFFSGGTEHQDQYFREHDEVFNRAVDYWTPSPESVHWSGQIVGGLMGSLLEYGIGGAPAMIGSAILGTSEDLVRQGVQAETAVPVGVVQGAATAVGIWAPFLGPTWTKKALSGIAANVPVGIAQRYLSNAILMGTGNEKQAEQFQAFDKVALATDILMPLVFARVAQFGENKDAVLVANQAKHLEIDTLPGVPLSQEAINLHVQAMQKAMADLAEGRPVDVSAIFRGDVVPAETDLSGTVRGGKAISYTMDQAPSIVTAEQQAASGLLTTAAVPGRTPIVKGDVFGLTRSIADVFGIGESENLTYKVIGFDGDKVKVSRVGAPQGAARTTTFDLAELQSRINGGDIAVHAKTPNEAAIARGELRPSPAIGGGDIGQPEWFDTTPRIQAQAEFAKQFDGLVPEPKQPPKLVDSPAPTEGQTIPTIPGETTTPEMKAAQQRIAQGDLEIITGEDANGQPIRQKASEALAAEPSLPAKVFQAAVTCFLGG